MTLEIRLCPILAQLLVALSQLLLNKNRIYGAAEKLCLHYAPYKLEKTPTL